MRILSKLVKARFFALVEKTGLLEKLPRRAFDKDWNVDEEAITFAYTDTRTGADKLLTLKPFEFIRRFLQHVLPKGLMKVRYFGFLHPSSSIPLKLAVALLEAAKDVYAAVDRAHAESEPGAPFCPRCSGSAQVLFFSPPAARLHSGFT